MPPRRILPSAWSANRVRSAASELMMVSPAVPNVASGVPSGSSRATTVSRLVSPLASVISRDEAVFRSPEKTILPSGWRMTSDDAMTVLYDPVGSGMSASPAVPKVVSSVPLVLYRRTASPGLPVEPVGWMIAPTTTTLPSAWTATADALFWLVAGPVAGFALTIACPPLKVRSSGEALNKARPSRASTGPGRHAGPRLVCLRPGRVRMRSAERGQEVGIITGTPMRPGGGSNDALVPRCQTGISTSQHHSSLHRGGAVVDDQPGKPPQNPQTTRPPPGGFGLEEWIGATPWCNPRHDRLRSRGPSLLRRATVSRPIPFSASRRIPR